MRTHLHAYARHIYVHAFRVNIGIPPTGPGAGDFTSDEFVSSELNVEDSRSLTSLWGAAALPGAP